MTTMDAAASPAPQRSRGAKLGAWALGLAILPFVYLAVLFMVVLFGLGERGNSVAVVAYAMFFIAFVVVPGSLLASLAFGIAALVANRRLGKLLAVFAMVLIVVAVVLVVIFVLGSSGPLSWTNF